MAQGKGGATRGSTGTGGKPRRVMAKLILLGDGAVGKTSLISQYVFSMFDPHYVETLGTNVTARVEKLETPKGPLEVRLQIWDIIGQERFDSIYTAYYQEADGVLLVCDGTRSETLDSLSGWLRSAEEVLGNFPAVFVVNKSDLPATFTLEEVRQKLRGMSSGAFGESPIFQTSAKTGDQVGDAFGSLARSIAQKKGHLS
ncbi:MAG: GTP-binding protein [Euryarchaeota archaeon]|nr:GTP-binding protein [Euryarchaeota archaeon]MDE1836289.1 GTP-binding protein [Euryarchaeota archaeon]MDE1879087.1 GTP-binding protein [Euryarchaeota archaeon]MDE2044315.1 GTP-binding protein [Thermoplasmata archaeon]